MDELAWACLHEPQHSFALITSLLYTGEMLYVAGVPDASSSWRRDRQQRHRARAGDDAGGGAGTGQQATNATTYTIARMSQSPASFRGKYESWGDVGGDSDKGEGSGRAEGTDATLGTRGGNNRRRRGLRRSGASHAQQRESREDRFAEHPTDHSSGAGMGFGGRVYNGTVGSVNCTGADQPGDGHGGRGRYTPLCGVDASVSPGGDDKYRRDGAPRAPHNLTVVPQTCTDNCLLLASPSAMRGGVV